MLSGQPYPSGKELVSCLVSAVTQSWIIYGRKSRLLITTLHSINGMGFFMSELLSGASFSDANDAIKLNGRFFCFTDWELGDNY